MAAPPKPSRPQLLLMIPCTYGTSGLEVWDQKWGSCGNMSLLEAYIHLAVLVEVNL